MYLSDTKIHPLAERQRERQSERERERETRKRAISFRIGNYVSRFIFIWICVS